MQIFDYQAVDKFGSRREGSLEAGDSVQAARLLRDQGLLVVSLKPASQTSLAKLLALRRGVSVDEKALFTRELAVMINAGLPITQSLQILKRQSRNPLMQETLEAVVNAIDGGSSLHAALGNHPKVFSRLYVSLVRAGEASGQLDTILTQLADSMENEAEFKAKVKGAMIYPVIIVLVMLAVIILMFVFVIPRLSQVYSELGADLPLITRVLLGVSGVFNSFWWLFALGSVGGVIGLRFFAKTPRGRYFLDNLKFKLPVFGSLGKEIQLADFTRTFALLISSGVPILDALEISRDTLNNIFMREALDGVRDQVEHGRSLAESLKRQPIFPILLSEMVAVGEQTGKVDEITQKVADYFQSDADNQVKNLASALEPIIMVGLGISVAVLVIALLLPVYSLTSKF